MKVVGSVAPENVPPHQPARPRRGEWTALAVRVLRDYERGMVTVIDVVNDDERKTVWRGVFDYLRKRRRDLEMGSSVSITARNELRLYLWLKERA